MRTCRSITADNVIGERHGHLTIIEYVKKVRHISQSGIHYVRHIVKCVCDCGFSEPFERAYSDVVNSKNAHCPYCDGNGNRKTPIEPFDPQGIIGRKYNHLTIIEYIGKWITPNGTTHRQVRCVCDCDDHTTIITTLNALKSGQVKSCGHLNRDAKYKRINYHGYSHTRLGKKYYNICNRCYNPNNRSYKNYGGRGIYVSEEWYTPGVPGNPGLLAFVLWAISNGWTDDCNLEVDRIDNDGPYAPWNCQLSDDYTQLNNTRHNSHIVDIDGERLTYALFERKHGLANEFVSSHMQRKYSLHAILFKVHHPDLDVHKIPYKDGYYDKDGFKLIIPRLETMQFMYDMHKLG